MKINTLILDIIEGITFPIAFLGYLWYIIVEAPLFLGRTRANQLMTNIAIKADEETHGSE